MFFWLVLVSTFISLYILANMKTNHKKKCIHIVYICHVFWLYEPLIVALWIKYLTRTEISTVHPNDWHTLDGGRTPHRQQNNENAIDGQTKMAGLSTGPVMEQTEDRMRHNESNLSALFLHLNAVHYIALLESCELEQFSVALSHPALYQM